MCGPMEGKGPLAPDFDVTSDDIMLGQKSAERAEEKFLEQAAMIALEKANLKPEDIEFFLAGDLLNQIISSSYAARQLEIPYLGLYGACSTVAEGITLGATLIDGGFADKVLVAVSSHYQTAERQYRYPIELNIQRRNTAQYTVTGGAACVLASQGNGPRVTMATIGRVLDYGIKDISDMGSAMAPAAADTLFCHFQDTATRPEDYDLVVTGDLARIGTTMITELMKERGIILGENYSDCGLLIYNPQQNVGAGGSGCACSGLVILGHLVKRLSSGELSKVLAVPTGALQSPVSYQQGESIPGVAHGIVLEA